MSELRLHEGELNIMELLWSNKELAAKDISKIIKEIEKSIPNLHKIIQV